MQFFIANCTLQVQIVPLRLGDMKSPLTVRIEAGRQVAVPKPDLTMKDVEDILNQMRKYGMVTVEEAQHFRPGRQIVFIGNPEKYVPENLLKDIFDQNRGVLTDQGVEMRRIATLAARKNMIDRSGTQQAADHLELSIEEQPGPGQTNLADLYGEGHRINMSAPLSRGRQSKRSGRRT